MNIERALLWNSLCNLGDLNKMKLHFDGFKVLSQLEQYKDNWCPYNVKKDKVNNRWGLPLTSHSGDILDNYHLNSFGYMQRYHDVEMREENFTTPTSALNLNFKDFIKKKLITSEEKQTYYAIKDIKTDEFTSVASVTPAFIIGSSNNMQVFLNVI